MDTFNGFTLFTILLFAIPVFGIVIKLFSSYYNNEIVKEMFGEEKYNWMLEQYKEKRRREHRTEAKLFDLLDKIRLKIMNMKYLFVMKKIFWNPIKINE